MPDAVNHARNAAIALLLALVAACGGSSGVQTPTAPTPPQSSQLPLATRGVTTSAATDAAAPTIAITADGLSGFSSNSSGAFTIGAATRRFTESAAVPSLPTEGPES